MDTRESSSLTYSTTTCQRNRGWKSVLDSLKHMAEHSRIAPARASKRAHEPEVHWLAQARVPRQFAEVRKECFEHLERPFALATVCVAVDDEKRVISSCPVLCRLQKLARLARPAHTRMMQRDFPEDWVHNSGRLVVVGSAAHPFPVCSFPTCLHFW